jgi:hypothetical protein
VKGEALSLIQFELSGYNEIFDELAKKADANIPRVPLGGLTYGQYEASNLLDLSENSWELNEKRNSYNYLKNAEEKIKFIEEGTYKDEVLLRLLLQYLKHKKQLKALWLFNQIVIPQIRLKALKKLCYYFIKNDSKRLRALMKYAGSDKEKRIIVKSILFHLNSIDSHKFNELLLNFLSLIENQKNVSQIESHRTKEENYKLPPIQLDIKKTYPPFFTLLHEKVIHERYKKIFNELSVFQKLYFSKDEKLVENILLNNDRNVYLKLGESVFSKLLNIVKRSDFDAFKKERIIMNNKFHVILLIKCITRYAKNSYLFIDQLENQLDAKLFNLCIESVVYNNKLNNIQSGLDLYKNYQITKVLRSERIANLIVNK